jgi:hypothetical protein
VAIGDLNADGRPDLAVANANSNYVSILLGNGNGTFASAVNSLAGNNPFSLAIGDLNADGRPDLAVATSSNGSILLNATIPGSAPPPVFTQQPVVGQVVEVGGTASFTSTADFRGASPTYQWRRNGTPIVDGDNIAGATTSTLTINPVRGSDVAWYDVQAISPACGGGTNVTTSISTLLAVTSASPPSPSSCPASFAAPAFSAAGTNPYAAATADLNGDDLPDVVISNGASGDLSVMLGSGDGTFQPAVQYPAGFRPSAAAVADFNGDGFPDLVTANFGTPATILLGQGDGTFSPASTIGSSGGGGGIAIATADFNADSRPDLALTRNDNQVVVMLNLGNGTFGPALLLPAGTNPQAIAARDLNADGRPDLVVVNSGGASVFLASGNGTFAAAQAYSAGTNPTNLAADDLNADGIPDIVITNQDSANVSVLMGLGSGAFAPAINYPCGAWPTSVAITDLNGDGRPDLAIANHVPSAATVLLGNGNGSFAAPAAFPEGDRPFGIAAGDFNRDGRPDLVLANYWGNNVSVLLNTGASIGFALQPQSQSVAPGTDVTFTVTTTGTGPFAYQWRRNGVPIPGEINPELFLGSVGTANMGFYDVQVRGGCNPNAATTSAPAMLWIENTPGCPADFNLDGGVDGADIADFFFHWENGC